MTYEHVILYKFYYYFTNYYNFIINYYIVALNVFF